MSQTTSVSGGTAPFKTSGGVSAAPSSKGQGSTNKPRWATIEEVNNLIDHLKELHEQKLQTLNSEITTKLSKIENIPTSKELAWGIVGLFAAVFAFILSMLAIMGDRWDNGLSNGTALGEKLQSTDTQIQENNRAVRVLIEKMDHVIGRVDNDSKIK